MATIRLFDENAYKTQFEGVIVSCEENDEGNYVTVLEQTLFFPEQGGQTSDLGILGGAEILHVYTKDEVIYHVTKDKPADGKGVIDWKHRYSNMKQHSGEHIISGLLHKKYGYNNVGFHLSDHVVTLDTSGPLTVEQINELEDEANAIIEKGIEVKTFYPSNPDDYDYRSKSGIVGEVRLVEIEDVDLCACCAPHVKNVHELGILKIVEAFSYKGGMRLSILCGERAIAFIRENEKILKDIGLYLSCGKTEILAKVEKLSKEKSRLEYELRSYQAKALESELEKESFVFTSVTDGGAIRGAINNALLNRSGYVGVFSKSGENYSYIIASKDKDCTSVLNIFKEHGIKGGGKKEMIQGQMSLDEASIRSLISEI